MGQVLLHLCALWSEGPPRQAGLRQTSCACAPEQSCAPTSLPRLGQKACADFTQKGRKSDRRFCSAGRRGGDQHFLHG